MDVLDGDIDYGYSACFFEKDVCTISDVFYTDDDDNIFGVTSVDDYLESTNANNIRRKIDIPGMYRNINNRKE